MKEIYLTQGKTTIVDDEDYEKLIKLSWQHDDGYAFTGSFYGAGRFKMEEIILGRKSGFLIDHKDRNSLNNQKYNLRYATHSQNMQNRKLPKNNTSGFRGVTFHTRKGKWMSSVKLNGITQYLGYFNTKEEAALKYNERAKQIHGEFAVLNQI